MINMDRAELIARQKEIDEQYIKEGLTDEVLEKQIELNKLRNEHDVDIGDDYRQ